MSGEIVVPETPNWLQGLEEKREKRLKARLGHEAGAGAPCLKCGDKCPGLDLHFWRKACKICRCPKEEHDVHDDDIYGWAQFQLLGSKPNKIKTTIVLPGKKDEVELEWTPKGQKETIDKYLKTLPPEALPVKGSQAAQERKQMLQKQIPIHDIDPSLCHELNEEEVKKMEEYIAHIKKSSVGVGQIVNLSSVIKANLHNISPQEAHIIASRYSKGIPFSEIIKLQSGLAKNLEKLTLTDPKNPRNKTPLPNMQSNKLVSNITEQDVQNPLVTSKFKDITHPWYTDSSPNKGLPEPQFAQGFKSGQPGGMHSKNPHYPGPDYTIDQKLLQGTNFDPSRTPSQFLGYHTPGYRPVQHEGLQSQDQNQNEPNQPVSYDKVSSGRQGTDVSFSTDVAKSAALKSGDLGGQKAGLPYAKFSGGFRPGEVEYIEGVHGSVPSYASCLRGDKKLPHSEQYGFENPYFNQNRPGSDLKRGTNPADGAPPPKSIIGKVPECSASTCDPQTDTQDPKAPRSVKDLIYSTYNPSKGPLPEYSNEDTVMNQSMDPTVPGYDPNVTFNTYKHDPSVIKYENPQLLGKSDPAQPIGGANKSRFNPRNSENPWQGDLGSGAHNLRPGHPNYDPQNPYGLGNFDPKTGKYFTGEGKYGNYDPKNPEEGRFGPEHPNDYPKNPYGPAYFDPRTGKYGPGSPGQKEFGPGHPNYDPNNPQNTFGPGSFDPQTGKYLTGEGHNPDEGKYDPSHFGPRHPQYHSRNPHEPYQSEYFDPKTEKHFPGDGSDNEIGNYDPGNPRGPYAPGNYNPNTGKNIAGPGSTTGKYSPVQGHPSEFDKFDPLNPQSYPGYGNNDPGTGDCGNLRLNRPQNIPGIVDKFDPSDPENSGFPAHKLGNRNTILGKPRKALSQLQPGQINVPEDYLEPHLVNIGAIQDIDPEIRAATTELNPGYDNESVYSDNGAEYSPESIREILNNIKLPDCHYCKKPFDENEYAVTVDRANVLFHAQCFKCAGCNQSLADNIYFYHKDTDNVYCGRDYAKIKGYPRCTACDELIFTKEYCLAENSTFHLKHFCCFQCDTPLAGQEYTLEDEKPYCLPCYETSKAAKCSTCENVIKPDEVGCQLNGVHFHAEDRCFRCIVCSAPLMGKKLLLRDKKLYCSHDCFNSVKK